MCLPWSFLARRKHGDHETQGAGTAYKAAALRKLHMRQPLPKVIKSVDSCWVEEPAASAACLHTGQGALGTQLSWAVILAGMELHLSHPYSCKELQNLTGCWASLGWVNRCLFSSPEKSPTLLGRTHSNLLRTPYVATHTLLTNKVNLSSKKPHLWLLFISMWQQKHTLNF